MLFFFFSDAMVIFFFDGIWNDLLSLLFSSCGLNASSRPVFRFLP